MPWLDPLRTTLQGCQAIIWLAGWLVPAPLRTQWKELWRAKIFHWTHFLAESGHLDTHNRMVLARECWGAFDEALWLRFDRDEFMARKDRLLRNPGACLAACTVLVFALILGGGFLSRSRSLLSSAINHPDRVAVVSFDGKYVRVRSETLLYLGSVWKDNPLTSQFALYSWGPARIAEGSRRIPLVESRVEPAFFRLLGVHPALGKLFDGSDCNDCAVLSYDFWNMHFHSNPGVIGQTLNIDGQDKTIIGVLPQNFSLLSSSAGVWTSLGPATLRFSNFMNRVGAVGLLKQDGDERRLERDLVDRSENAGYRFTSAPMHVSSVKEQYHRMLWAYAAFLMLALVSAAGIAWMLRSGAGFLRVSLTPRQRLRWWGFFLAKSAALTASAYLLSWIAVHRISSLLAGTIYPMADEIAVWTFLPLAVALLSWSLLDQQKRCRVCLSRLGMSIDIGRPGSVLLNWAGTEMVCPEGHGTLYVPESEANSLERDRWNSLDESWAGLFRAS